MITKPTRGRPRKPSPQPRRPPAPVEIDPIPSTLHGLRVLRLTCTRLDPRYRYVVERLVYAAHWARVWLLEPGARSLDRTLLRDSQPGLPTIRLRALNPTEEP